MVAASAASAQVPTNSVRDQSFTEGSNLNSIINDCCAYVAQTFTAGLSGDLTGLSVDVQPLGDARLRLAVRAVDANGDPVDSELGSVELAGSGSALSNVIELPQPIRLMKNHHYAIVANEVDGPPLGTASGNWRGATDDLYPRGIMLAEDPDGGWFASGADYDVHFKTFVHPICRGLLATIVGTSRADTLGGTDGPDVIAALGGVDTIDAGGGDDTICGGGGADRIMAGEDNDLVLGSSGNDVLSGQGGADTILGEAGNDSLDGGDGTDTCNGGDGIDVAVFCEQTSGIPRPHGR